MTTSTDNASTTTVSESTSSDGSSRRRAVSKKPGRGKKKKGRRGDRGAGLLGLPADAFKSSKPLRLPGSSASESDPWPTPSTSVDSGPSSAELSFSQTTKRNTAKNGRTINGGKLLKGNKKKDQEVPPLKKSKDKIVVDKELPLKKAKAKSLKSGKSSLLKKPKRKVTISADSPPKKVKDKVFVDEGLPLKKGIDKIIEEKSPRKKVKEKAFVDDGLPLKKGKDKAILEEKSPRKKVKDMIPKDEGSPRKKGKSKIPKDEMALLKAKIAPVQDSPRKKVDKVLLDEDSSRKKAKDKLPKDVRSPRKKDKAPKEEASLRKKPKNKIPQDEASPRKKPKDKIPQDEASPRKKPKDMVPQVEESPRMKPKDMIPQVEESPRMKPKKKATMKKKSGGKKSKKMKQVDSEEDSSLPLEKPQKRIMSERAIPDSVDSELKPAQGKPSASKFIVYLGDKDSSRSYDSRQASTSLTDASYDLARFYLQCKERQKQKALQAGGSQRSDTYLILNKCCRCGAGSEMVGEITGKLPACHYCLEEMGFSRRPPTRTRSFRVVDRTYDTLKASNVLLEPTYSRSACTTEVSELRRYCDPSDKVFLCGSSVAIDGSEKYGDLPEDYYRSSWREKRPLKPAERLHRRRSFYSRPRSSVEPDTPTLPVVRITAHLSRERLPRNREFRRSSHRLLDAPPETQRTRKSGTNYGRHDSQSLMLGDTREGGWEPDYDLDQEEMWLDMDARMSSRSRRSKEREREERKGQSQPFMQRERLQDRETEEGEADVQRGTSDDEIVESSPADESTSEVPSSAGGASEANEAEPEEVAQQAWERYARDYKRFQENLAEWKYEQEKAHRRRLRDGGDDGPRRPLTPPMPNTSVHAGFEDGGSHMGSEERRSKNEDDAMHIRIAVSPSRRSRLVVNEMTSWTPGPFPPVGAEGWLPQAQAGQPLPVTASVAPVPYQPTPLHCAPAAQKLFFPPQSNPSSPAHSIPSPVSPMSPPTSGVCSPVSAGPGPKV